MSVLEKNKYMTYVMPLVVMLAGLMLFLNYWIVLPAAIFVFLFAVIMFVCGNLLPKNLSRGIKLFLENSGLVSGLVGFITLIIPGILFSITNFLNLDVFYKFSAIMLITSSISLYRDLLDKYH